MSVMFQYRIESMMLRLAKPMNFIAVSATVQQSFSLCLMAVMFVRLNMCVTAVMFVGFS